MFISVDGKSLGVSDDVEIFSFRRGNFIFRVSLLFPRKVKNTNVVEPPYVRYMIIEVDEVEEGDEKYVVVKDYMYFDITLAEEYFLNSLKERYINELEDSFIRLMNEDKDKGLNGSDDGSHSERMYL